MPSGAWEKGKKKNPEKKKGRRGFLRVRLRAVTTREERNQKRDGERAGGWLKEKRENWESWAESKGKREEWNQRTKTRQREKVRGWFLVAIVDWWKSKKERLSDEAERDQKQSSKEGACERNLEKGRSIRKDEGRLRFSIDPWACSYETVHPVRLLGAYNALRSNCIFPFTFINCKVASFLCFFRFLGMFDGEARSFSLFFDDAITVSSETEIFSCTLVHHNRHWFMYVLVVAVLMFFVWMWPPAFVPRPVILNKGCCNKFGGLGWLQQLFFFFGLSIACIRCVWFVC